MYVVYSCASCRHPLRMRRCYQGQTVRCPSCAAVLTIPEAIAAESDPEFPRKVRAAPCGCGCLDGTSAALSSIAAAAAPNRPILPWLLLAPAILALGLLVWAGHGVHWAALGVGLGSLYLLVGQRAAWSLSLRVGPSLALALLGHGLTWAGPLMNSPALQPFLLAAQSPDDSPKPLVPNLLSPDEAAPPANPARKPIRFMAREMPPRADLVPVAARLGSLLAIAVDADPASGGSIFVTTTDGSLRQFSYPAFEPRAVYQLAQPAYRAVMDRRRGRLWVAASDPRVLRCNDDGDRPEGFGDLHVYDVRALPSASKSSQDRLQPRHTLALSGTVLELLISPDSRWLFFLARRADGVYVGRIDADSMSVDTQRQLPGPTRALCSAADGKTLYAAGGREVFVLDPASLRRIRHVEMDADINAMAAGNDGRVYLAEEGQWTRITRLDLNGSKPIPWQWNSKLHGRVYLRLAPDRYRLYVGSSSVISNHLDALLTGGHGWKTPPQIGMALPDFRGPVRGEFFITPDGKYLLNRWGRVFRLTQGEREKPTPAEMPMGEAPG